MKELFNVEVYKIDSPTKANRIYKREILQKQVDRFEEIVRARGFWGELGPVTDSIIKVSNASHVVTKLWLGQSHIMADIETLETPSGRILESLLNNGAKIEFCLVGVGSGTVRQDSYELIVGDSYSLIQIQAILQENMSLGIRIPKHRTIDAEWLNEE